MRHATDLVLVVLGAFTIAAGVLIRFYVAPRVIQAPVDTYQVTTLRAENATYFDADALKPRTGATVTATSTVRGDVPSSHDGIAVWDSFTAVEDLARHRVIDVQRYRVAFDRHTGLLTNCCGAAVQGDADVRQSGLGLFWPIKVAKTDYRLFDTETRRAWTISYDGEDSVDGVRAYRFVQHIPTTKVGGAVPDVPGALLGLGKKAGAVPVDRYYRADVTYWIDPRTGAPVDQRQHTLSTLVARTGSGRLVVADLDLRLTDASRRTLLARSQEGARNMQRLTTTLPELCLLAGMVPVGAGLLITRNRRTAGRRQEATEPAAAPA